MLQQSSSSGSRRIGWALSALMLLAMVPIQLVAQAPSNRDVRRHDLKSVTAASTVATPKQITPKVDAKVILVPTPTTVLEATLESAGTLVLQEPKELTEEFLRQQLLETQKALRAMQEENAARTDREKLRQAEIEAILKSMEEQGSRSRAAREIDQRAGEVEKVLRETFEQRTRGDYEKALAEDGKILNAQRQQQPSVNQQEMATQLDNLRRSIDELNVQLEEMRKMERRLREQLNRKN